MMERTESRSSLHVAVREIGYRVFSLGEEQGKGNGYGVYSIWGHECDT